MARRSDAELATDIIQCIDRVQGYVRGLDLLAFLENSMVQDAVMRNIEIIGEAVKGLSADFRRRNRDVPWSDIARMRDRLIHHYSGVNLEVVWDVIQNRLPRLQQDIAKANARTRRY